jgi:hypothetical protein
MLLFNMLLCYCARLQYALLLCTTLLYYAIVHDVTMLLFNTVLCYALTMRSRTIVHVSPVLPGMLCAADIRR